MIYVTFRLKGSNLVMNMTLTQTELWQAIRNPRIAFIETVDENGF